jgi:hypothetical protein
MSLKEADKEWFRTELSTTKNDITTEWGKTVTALNTTITSLGKRVVRLEHAFGLLAGAARSAVVEGAKKNHARLLEKMFEDSDLVALPPVEKGSDGRHARAALGCDIEAVKEATKRYGEDFEVEIAKVGFRLVHKSRSAQRRRREAAEFLKAAKKPFEANLGLLLQYDKPYELREIQTSGHKFLALVKKLGGTVVAETSVKSGFLLVNGVRIAPEYLVPKKHRWKDLADHLVSKVRGWGSRPPGVTDMGVMTDVFGEQFAADAGVFDLNEIVVEEEDFVPMDVGPGAAR